MSASRWLALFIFLAAVGCARKATVIPDPVVVAAGPARPSPPAAQPPVPVAAPEPARFFGPLHYALDSAQLSFESVQELERLADHLRAERELGLAIEGHTCDLGTEEYNLALANQRASAARDHLVRLGVEPSRISILSFGEERPAAPEGAREKNRRGELVLKSAGRSSVQ